MGDIFRRNAFNLGLHVVQSPEAVADAQDGDELTFDPVTRQLGERDAGEDLRAGAAVAEGRGDPPRRRHLRGRPARVPQVGRDRARRSTGPIPDAARGMTTTEQIIWAHRVDKDLKAVDLQARRRRCASTRTCCRRRTAPRRSRSTPSTRSPAATRSTRGRPRSPTTTSSSPAAPSTTSRPASAASSRACRTWRSRTTPRPATASSISISPSRGW